MPAVAVLKILKRLDFTNERVRECVIASQLERGWLWNLILKHVYASSHHFITGNITFALSE